MRVKISDELIARGYDKELVNKILKDIHTIVLDTLSENKKVVFDKVLTLKLSKFDPTAFKSPLRFSHFPFMEVAKEFKRKLKYQTEYLLSDVEKEYNLKVAEKIRLSTADDGEAEEE